MKKLKQLIEFLIIVFIFKVLNYFPINIVSSLGGKLFKFIGPLTNSHKTAILNYKTIFNNLSDNKIKKDIIESWDNLGKTFIEFAILNKILDTKNNRIKIIGIDNLKKIKNNNEQVIFFSIHQANWELLVPTIDNFGISVGAIYRHINNPYINKYILKKRKTTLTNNGTFYTPKGKESAKEILQAINNKLSMILLIDQKDSSGSNVSFFNLNAKTQIGFLKIARKYNLKLIPIQILREKINNFSIIFHSPVDIFKKNKSDIEAMIKIHKIIEKWIISNPTQWFWQHNRFN